MSQEEENNNQVYNISISTDNKKKRKLEESEKPFETYILIQNEELSNQNKQLIIDMKELEREKDEIDNFLDKSDRDKLHLKNFTKTIKDLNELYMSLVDSKTIVMRIQNNVINIFISFYLFQFIFVFFNIHYLIYITMYSGILMYIGTFYKKFEKNSSICKKYKNEITEIKKSNQYLDDYIDNM